MQDGLVTIVVPIYNVEKYLDRCLNSIVDQTYRHLEIILVDDGSPDRCPAMCDEWAKKDSRIKVIHKQNAGLGMARNTGIENATGKYIFFFDSDDYVALDTVEKCYASAKKYDSEIVMYGMNSVKANGEIISSAVPKAEKEFYTDREITEFILPNMMMSDPSTGKVYNFNMSAWGRMYSVKLINDHNWRFASERKYISEDWYSLLVLYQYVKRVSVINEAFYYYCCNPTSLTHTYAPDRYDRICSWHTGMMEVFQAANYPITVKKGIASQFLGNVIAALKLIVTSDRSSKEQKREIQRIVKDDYLQDVIKDIGINCESVARRVFIGALKLKFAALIYILIKSKVGAKER
jgi:glycosyltransferase involved in cell wall biosynthesis